MAINVLEDARQLGGYLLNTEDFKDSPTKRALPWLIWSLINSTYLQNQVFSRLQNPCISFSLQPFQLFESGRKNHCICPLLLPLMTEYRGQKLLGLSSVYT